MRYYMVMDADDPKDFSELYTAKDETDLKEQIFEWIYENDAGFMEHISTFTVNMSFWEPFYEDENGCFWEEGTGDIRQDLITRYGNEEEIEKYIHEEKVKNINEYFKKHKDYADLAIKGLHGDEVELPKDFYKYCFMNEPLGREGWWGGFLVKDVTDKIRAAEAG